MILRAVKSFSGFAFCAGIMFFCISLTPSLLPRPVMLQGVLSGIVFAVGYCAGISVLWVWRFLQLPGLPGAVRLRVTIGLTVIASIAAAVTLVRAPVWQNSLRDIMGMDPIETIAPFQIVGTALGVALGLIFAFRLLVWVGGKIIWAVEKLLPPRLAIGLGAIAFAGTLLLFVDGFIVKRALSSMDAAAAAWQRTTDANLTAPAAPTSSGSPESLISWDDVGRTGKGFLANGATGADITAVTGRPALDPIRIYGGYDAADTLEGRADLALADLIRAGGFDRSTLVIATVTGTGWMDPAAVEPLVFLHNGDIAIATIQYSFSPSWLTLAIDPDRSRDAASALFDVIYAHWTALPKDDRPELYLFGLSLGALGSEASVELISMLEDPINGALWAGPPFASTVWPDVVAGRNPGSPAWRPVFRDGSLIRFMARDGVTEPAGATWGAMRLLYLQQPSDPMSFFSPDLAWRKPDWLVDRGPDISPHFEWYPIVTFLQVMFDIPLATSVPAGHGHTFTAASYIDAWMEIFELEEWTPGDLNALKTHFADAG